MIRARSGGQCECLGECGHDHAGRCPRTQGELGYWDDAGDWHRVSEWEAEAIGNDGAVRIVRTVLTVGHRDHTPENSDPANLRDWCQRCHLSYDRDHHAATRSATRRAGKAAGDLFPEVPNG